REWHRRILARVGVGQSSGTVHDGGRPPTLDRARHHPTHATHSIGPRCPRGGAARVLMTQLPSTPAASDIPFPDPIAMELLDGVPPTGGDLGVFVQQPRGLGLIDPMTLAKAYTTVRAITNAFGL